MKVAIAAALLLLSAPADAEVWRVKVTSLAEGELLAWPKNHCGPEVADHVRRVVLEHPYIEVIDGKMSARTREKRPVPAHRQVIGDVFVAFYDVTDTRTIAFTIRWRSARTPLDGKGGTVPVEVSVIDYKTPEARDNPDERINACRETWLGKGVRI